MKFNCLAVAFLLFTCTQFSLAQEKLIEAIRGVGAIEKGDAPFDHRQYLVLSDLALQHWAVASQDDQARFSMNMFLIHFRRAAIFASSGEFNGAAEELKSEAALQKQFGGRLEHSTKSTETFFRDLVELQAQVAAETGSDPLAGRVGYSFEKDGEGFTAARLELGDDVAGITVPEIGADEALALVLRLNREGGKFVATPSRWLVVPKGRLPDVLKQATREVAFDSSGKMMVHRLQTQGDSSPKANPPAANNTHAPSFMQPPKEQVKTPEANPTSTPDEAPCSSMPWRIVVVLIVAATSLLWIWFKKRK